MHEGGLILIKVDIDFDNEQFRKVLQEELEKWESKKQNHTKWPPLLSRNQLMEFLGIKANKASELLNRQDFPVTREFGHPKVPTHLLMKWIEEHTQWVEKNTSYFDKAI